METAKPRFLKKVTGEYKTVDLGVLTAEDIAARANDTSGYLRILATEGNPRLLDDFMKVKQSIELIVPDRQTTAYNYCGSFVDVGRYVTGEPECMIDFSTYGQTQFIDVLIYLDSPGTVSSEKYFTFYAMILSVIDYLENNNYRAKVRVICDGFHSSSKTRYVAEMILKEYNEPVNLAAYSGILLDRYFFHYGFCALEKGLFGCCIGIESTNLFERIQSDEQILLPSLFGWSEQYGKIYADLTPEQFVLRDFIKDIGLAHLLPE